MSPFQSIPTKQISLSFYLNHLVPQYMQLNNHTQFRMTHSNNKKKIFRQLLGHVWYKRVHFSYEKRITQLVKVGKDKPALKEAKRMAGEKKK
ncbi:hypothetical protein Pfo_029505 [Paulownia fortunei]|nr:hypothetical protein Pfo_029505 [Paulownia fortunei]